MKHLLLLALIFSSGHALANNEVETITCALETKRVGDSVRRARAQQVIQLSLVGENVFRLKSYRGHFYDSVYRATSNGPGRVVELTKVVGRGLQVAYRTYLSTDLSCAKLQHDGGRVD